MEPVKIEAARSGRSRCRQCRRAIKKGELRLGIEVAGSGRHDGPIQHWFHLACAAVAEHRDRLARALAAHDGPAPSIDELVARWEASRPLPLPRVERASAVRSCVHCRAPIGKGGLCVAAAANAGGSRGRPRYLHCECAGPHTRDPSLAEKLEVNSSLSADVISAARELLEGLQQPERSEVVRAALGRVRRHLRGLRGWYGDYDDYAPALAEIEAACGATETTALRAAIGRVVEGATARLFTEVAADVEDTGFLEASRPEEEEKAKEALGALEKALTAAEALERGAGGAPSLSYELLRITRTAGETDEIEILLGAWEAVHLGRVCVRHLGKMGKLRFDGPCSRLSVELSHESETAVIEQDPALAGLASDPVISATLRLPASQIGVLCQALERGGRFSLPGADALLWRILSP